MHTVADSRIVMLDKGWLIHIQECVYVRMLAEVIDNFFWKLQSSWTVPLGKKLVICLCCITCRTLGYPLRYCGGFRRAEKASTIFENAIDQPFQAEITENNTRAEDWVAEIPDLLIRRETTCNPTSLFISWFLCCEYVKTSSFLPVLITFSIFIFWMILITKAVYSASETG